MGLLEAAQALFWAGDVLTEGGFLIKTKATPTCLLLVSGCAQLGPSAKAPGQAGLARPPAVGPNPSPRALPYFQTLPSLVSGSVVTNHAFPETLLACLLPCTHSSGRLCGYAAVPVPGRRPVRRVYWPCLQSVSRLVPAPAV